ncbi:MAG: hypothetical protein AAB365_04075 [Patescibacteria group bacterium]
MNKQTTEPATLWGRCDARFKQLPLWKRCLIVTTAGITLGMTVFLWNYGPTIIESITK